MTALAGILSFAGRPDLSGACGRMLGAQRIYGSGKPICWSDGPLAMGRDLYATLPEDGFDSGPVVLENGRFALVADVRLDNREDLWRDLNLPLPDLTRQSDTAVLMTALIRWGEAGVDRLAGDFAFAFWDGTARRLVLARDFLGQRPLHFHRGRDFFAFASMAKGLHALPEVPPRPDQDMVAEFLALLPETGGRSFYEGVERAPPGHVITVTPTGISTRRYWNPAPPPLKLRNAADYDEAVREQLDRAVADRLRGAGAMAGAHLSGGLDSGAVAATAARLLAPSGRLAAFTAVPRAGYDGAVPRNHLADEGPLAAAVAALHPNIDHMLVRTDGRSPLAALDRNLLLFDRPVLNLCNGVWLDAIMDAAKQRRVTVMLTGQMGNMSFSFTGFSALPDLLARGRLIQVAHLARQLGANGISVRNSAAHALGPWLPAGLWRRLDRARGRRLDLNDYSAVNPARAEALSARAAQMGSDFSYRPPRDPVAARIHALQRTDLGNYNKGYLTGWGIDTRDPSADRRLIELCLSIPAAEYLRGGRPRAIARAAFTDRLPAAVLAEPRKGLQAADWHEGLAAARDEAATEIDRIAATVDPSGPLDIAMLRDLIADWPTGNWHAPAVQAKYRLALLRGLSGGHFIRKVLG
ncbi:MAG: asparagine synthase-related protein [Sphingomonas sp.]|jgi:asparagine synthase (glutamine-hydrolysing)|uniref:asparagine synthetase B family protein n=1 Tax=Sphingomonas sp. TaxID=28214 RepID=UPI0035681751